jgi:hypothetical protein
MYCIQATYYIITQVHVPARNNSVVLHLYTRVSTLGPQLAMSAFYALRTITTSSSPAAQPYAKQS